MEQHDQHLSHAARLARIVVGLVPLALLALFMLVLLGRVHAQPRAIEGGARESIIGESAASSPAGRAGAAGSALDRARSLSRDERALALAVAKVAANEASLALVRPADVALIYQCAEGHGETARARLAWLRAHSSCVLSDRLMSDAERAGNCPLSRSLADSDAQPVAWPERLAWARYRRRWAMVRAFARRLVSGEERMRPCASTPATWGSVRLDAERAIARGLVPLGCVDPQTGERLRNDGFARGGDAS